MKLLKTVAFTFLALAGMVPMAQAAGDQMGGDQAMPQMGSGHAMPQMTGTMAAAPLSEGEIRKVDKPAGKLTIKHGHLVNLDMPAMTMVFRVQDPAMLDKVKPGDKVRFRAENLKGAMTVTILEPAAP